MFGDGGRNFLMGSTIQTRYLYAIVVKSIYIILEIWSAIKLNFIKKKWGLILNVLYIVLKKGKKKLCTK